MKKNFILLTISLLLFVPLTSLKADSLPNVLKGKILLQVEDKGQSWYVEPVTKQRAFLGRPADAFRIMRELGLGISETDYNKFKNKSPQKFSGMIFLRVQAKGEAYYINPTNLKLYYLGRPSDAFAVMRELGLGIKNNDLNKIPVHEKYTEQSSSNTASNDAVSNLQKQLDEQAAIIKSLQEQQAQKEVEAKVTTMTSEQIYASYSAAIVYVNTPGGSGTGFIIDPGGYVVTNAHVVNSSDETTGCINERYDSVEIKLPNGNNYTGSVIGRDETIDLALIKVSAISSIKFPYIQLGNSDLANIGSDIVAIGYPLGIYQNPVLNEGKISQNKYLYDSQTYLAHSAKVQRGNSGGPLINDKGFVVGVVTMFYYGPNASIESMLLNEGFELAIPVNTLNSILLSLKSNRAVLATNCGMASNITPTTPETPTPTPIPTPSASPTVTFSTVSSNDQTTVASAAGALLYKGKIAANDGDNLKVSKIRINGTFGGGATTFADDWQRISLYKVNADGSETKLDDETSLGNTAFAFSGFTMDVPKGLSNGVYFTIRGDAKSSPIGGTIALNLVNDYTLFTVKDSSNNALGIAQYTIFITAGHVTTVATQGTYTLDFDTTEAGINNNMNVLAGNIVKVGRIKATAQKEAAIINDLVIQNTGDATNQTAARVYLYKDSAMTQLIGSADFANIDTNDQRALLQGINYTIPTTGNTYIYVGVLVKPIDYSVSPSSDATAAAATTIDLNIPADSIALGYSTKATGASTGSTLADTNAAPSSSSSVTATVMGAVISNISTDFANGLLANGTAKDIFSFKVSAPVSTNVDYDGQPLSVKVNDITFTVAASAGVSLANFKIERVGGANNERPALNAAGGATAMGNGTFVIDVGNSYTSGTLSDAIVKPGETATYVVRATISGVDANDSLQVTIEGLSANFGYTHNYATTGGTRAGDVAAVYTKLASINFVRGGSLTN